MDQFELSFGKTQKKFAHGYLEDVTNIVYCHYFQCKSILMAISKFAPSQCLSVHLLLQDPLCLLCCAYSLGWILPILFDTDETSMRGCVTHIDFCLRCISSKPFRHDFVIKLFEYGTCFCAHSAAHNVLN